MIGSHSRLSIHLSGLALVLTSAASVCAAQDALTVDPSGRIGVGTPTPVGVFDVRGSLDAAPLVNLINESGSHGGGLCIETTDGNGGGDALKVVTFRQNSPKVMLRIPNHHYQAGGSVASVLLAETVGNVGVGLSVPTAGLHLAREGGNYAQGSYLLVDSPNTTIGGGASIAGIVSARAGSPDYRFLRLANADGEKLVVNGLGHVGIGTGSPNCALNVVQDVGDGDATSQVEVSGVNAKLNLHSWGGSNDVLVQFFRAGQMRWRLGMQAIWPPEYAFRINYRDPVSGGEWTHFKIDTDATTHIGGCLNVQGQLVASVLNNEISLGDNAAGDGLCNVILRAQDQPIATLDGSGLHLAAGKILTVGSNSWSDHVFADDYRLRSLEEVAEHIAEHRHLPEVPSEAAIRERGIDTAAMFNTHMAKIEELTLYAIAADRQISDLRQQVDDARQQAARVVDLEARNSDLESRLDRLESVLQSLAGSHPPPATESP